MKIDVQLSSRALSLGFVFAHVVRGLLYAVVWLNRQHIRKFGLPPLYKSRVQYARDPRGVISIVDAATVLKKGIGHCAHLSCWRVAELREQGEQATLRIKWSPSRRRPGRLFHVQVRRAKGKLKGKLEDPSRRLGMV
jgi:hypothetical protein